MKKLFFNSIIVVCSVHACLQGKPSELPRAVVDKVACNALLRKPEVRAFLDVLAHGEGTAYHAQAKSADDQYRITFCGDGAHIKASKLTSFKDHPRERCCNPVGERIICATAAGRYMFLERTWDWVMKKLLLPDFSPASQDLAALYLLDVSGALDELIVRDNVPKAIAKASRFWAPMPGNGYNQPQTKIKELLRVYTARLTFYQSLGGV